MSIFKAIHHSAGVVGLYCILAYALGTQPTMGGCALALALTAMIRTYEKDTNA